MDPMPYRIATLIYCFNTRDEVLLIQRTRDPNRGLWSPPGGKLDTARGESPYQCACREAREEMGLAVEPAGLHLVGLISEHGYEGRAHWLMFLFEVKARVDVLPAVHGEGAFAFHSVASLDGLPMPETDRERIWPLFWRYRGGFFSAHCRCSPGGSNEWIVEETRRGRESG